MRTKIVLFLAFSFILLGGANAQEKKQPVKVSLVEPVSIPKYDSLGKTYFGFGLLQYSVQDLSGVGISGLMGLHRGNLRGVAISGLANVVEKQMSGIMVAGFSNVVLKDVREGAMLALANMTVDTMAGLQVGGANIAIGKFSGVQISPVYNLAATDVRAIQISGGVNVAGDKPTRGVQIASFLNVSVDTLEGLQVAIGNYSDHVKGLQFGVANMCEGSIVGGAQVGLINYSRDTTFVFKVGLVNINPNTRIQIVTTGGILDYVNLAVRFSNKPLYSMIGFGLPYNVENEDLSLTLNYRLGTSINLYKHKWFLNPDFGYSHIISDSESTEKYGTKFALRLRLSLEYQIMKRMGAFITGGISWDSEYGDVKFKTKGIFEAGLTFTLTKVG